MVARVIHIDGAAKNPAEGVRGINEQVIPRLRQAKGFVAAYWLRPKVGSAGMTVVLWENAESDAANEAEISKTRRESIEGGGMRITGNETYEVMAHS